MNDEPVPHEGAAAPLLRRISVFCGAHCGTVPAHMEAAAATGTLLAQAGIELVYGGAQVGCMGALADAALAAGGRVVGVMPRHLVDLERAHSGLSELQITDSMHSRKARMAQLADACIVLPGGIGTLDEFFELWTWSYLGLYRGAIGLCDVAGFYGPLLDYFDLQVACGFLPAAHRQTLRHATSPAALLPLLRAYRHSAEGKIAALAPRARAAAR